MKPIYLDYNATTPIDPLVAEAMKPYLSVYFGNPSSSHTFGTEAKQAVMKARGQVAHLIGCSPDEVIFTSGGTESNNYAIKGAAFAHRSKGNHIVTSAVEHPAVSEVCTYLESQGFSITRLGVDTYGRIDLEEFKRSIRPDTILITVMHANNEVGTLQPIREIGAVAREKNILFHTDAAQSVGKLRVDVRELGVDLLSVAGHKLYAPKGIGALYIKRGTNLDKLIHGADHEMNQRAGTENVLEIVGLGEACEQAARDLDSRILHMKETREDLHRGILEQWPQVQLNGHPEERLPNTLSLSFPGIEANTLLSELEGVAASAGAACHADTIDVSPVITAMKIPSEYAMGTIRFSTGKDTTQEEIRDAVHQIGRAVRRMSGEKEVPDPVETDGPIRLTQFTHGMGCACKIRPQYLEQVLKGYTVPAHPDILVSLESSDDAAVYRINESTAIIQTVDFFTPVVDDPYRFGAIAAANALSDVYAMGGTPLFALNIVGFPDTRLPVSVLKAILKGAGDKAAEAGIAILGGHTVEDSEPKFGMAVTGIIHPDRILHNHTLQEGDVLILTKPLGTGIIATAAKRGVADERWIEEAILQMEMLNKKAASIMDEFPVNACTDITGFGLLGHLKEMILQLKMEVRLQMASIPLITGAESLALENVIPGGTLNNLEFVAPVVTYASSITRHQQVLLNDAQTSGGLLIALPERFEKEMVSRLQEHGMNQASAIGKVVHKGVGKIFVD